MSSTAQEAKAEAGKPRRTVTEADVRLTYELFLNRAAVPQDALDKRVGADPAKYMSLLIQQERFRVNVVDRLNAGLASLGGAMMRTVSQEMVLQLADLLGLPLLPHLFDSEDVPADEFFRRLLCWPNFYEILTEEARALINLKAVEALPARRVVGAIDGCYGMEIIGWAFNQDDPGERVVLEIGADGQMIGSTICDQRRRDAKEALGARREGDIGFSFILPVDAAEIVGSNRFLVSVRDMVSKRAIAPPFPVHLPLTPTQGTLQEVRRRLDALMTEVDGLARILPRFAREASYPLSRYEDYFEAWLAITPAERLFLEQTGRGFEKTPRFSLVLPCSDPAKARYRPLFESLSRQIYPYWEIVLAGDVDEAVAAAYVENTFGIPRERLRMVFEPNDLASVRLSTGLAAATGDYVGFVGPSDALADDALHHFAEALQKQNAALLYSDADFMVPERDRVRHVGPWFKPGLDRDLLLQQNYIGFFLVERGLARQVGKLREDFDGVHDHDFLLRTVECIEDSAVQHLPRVLHHRIHDGAELSWFDKDETAASRRLRAAQEHVDRIAPGSAVRSERRGDGAVVTHRIDWCQDETLPTVTIIVPTRDRLDLIKPCLASVLASQPSYPSPFQVIVVDNGSVEAEVTTHLAELERDGRIEVLRYPHEFNWALLNNAAVSRAKGEVVIFLNNDTTISSPGWVRELAVQAMRPEVGAVGAKLLYPDGAIQHAGVLGEIGGIAVHDGLGCRNGDPGYMGRNEFVHGAIAVTGACMAVRTSLFDALGGFDGANFGVAFNDLDFCLRLREAGYRVVYTPYAVLFHFESESRGLDITPPKQERNRVERQKFVAKWGRLTLADPFYNPNFDRSSLPFSKIRPAGA